MKLALSKFRCKNCGREKEDHKAGTHQCPLTRHAFTHFHATNVFVADKTKPTRRKDTGLKI